MTAAELQGDGLHTDIEPSRHVPIDSPPVHGEESSSTTKQLSGRKVVNKDEEARLNKHSLPSQTPVLSIPAVSPGQSGQMLPLVLPRRHKSTSAVSTIQTTNVATHIATNPGARSLASNDVANRPGVSPPFQNKPRSPVSNIPRSRGGNSVNKTTYKQDGR